MTYDQLCDLGQAQERDDLLTRANAAIVAASDVPRRVVTWQLATTPAAIVGTIEAPNISSAAAIARAQYGSFHLVEWSEATDEQRAQAAAADDAERIARGDVCWECGEAVLDRQGRPSLCTDCGGSASTRIQFVPRGPQTPMALLPEFSDSREEPNGPTPLATPDVLEVWVSPRGHYLLGLATLQDGWATGDFAKFVLAMWSVVGFIPPCGDEARSSWFHASDGRYLPNDGDRRAHQRLLDERERRQARRVAAFGVRFEITEAGRAALDAAKVAHA